MFSFVQLQSIPIKEMCRNQCLKTPVSLSPFLLKSLNLIYGENPIKVLFLVSLLGKKNASACIKYNGRVNKQVISFNLNLGFCYAVKLERE